MSQPASLEEIDARLGTLPDSLVLSAEDSRALAKILELRIPAQPAVESHSPRRGLVRLGALATTVVAVLLLNVVAAYYAPTYGRALAAAPGIGGPSGQILAAFGLNSGEVTVFNDVSTSSGHTLRLTAGFADGLRTVLFVSIDGRGVTGNPKGFGMNPGDYGLRDYTVTDQFGHSYQGNLVSSPNLLSLEPLAWPASKVGARLTLHVTSLWPIWLRGDSTLPGDWTLHATLVSEPAHSLALPAPVHTAQANYTFTSIRSSTTTLIIHWKVDGPALDRVNQLSAQGGNRMDPKAPPGSPSAEETQLEHDYFWPRISDASGREVQLSDWGVTFSKPATGEITVFIPGPGRYRMRFGDALTANDLQRWIVVP
jgi:hypothetical protein